MILTAVCGLCRRLGVLSLESTSLLIGCGLRRGELLALTLICVLVSDGVTEALDGMPLEDSVRASNLHSATASELCERFMTKALAGRGPSGAPDWDDDRTVLVMRVRDGHATPRTNAPTLAAADDAV
jgi:serine/threonine protein phosphatase PrpC